MHEALAKVRSAVATKNIVPELTHYLVHDGYVHASNGHIIAAAPFPGKDLSFAVSAAQFDAVVAKLPDPVQLKVAEKWLTLSCGKYRGRVALNAEMLKHFVGPEGKKLKAPAKLVDKLRLMRPFISDNAAQPFATCLCLKGDEVYATNNVALVITDGTGLPKNFDCMLPCFALDYVLSRKETLVALQQDEHSISFHWDDGSWMRAALTVFQFPNIKPIADAADDPEVAITPEWREAYSAAASIADSSVKMYANKMVGSSGEGAEIEVECETPVPEGVEYTAWHPKFLTPVIEAANFWSPTSFPRPASFAGDEVYGVIMGRTGD